MPPVTSVALDSLLISVYRLLTLPREDLSLGPWFCSTSPAIANRTVTKLETAGRFGGRLLSVKSGSSGVAAYQSLAVRTWLVVEIR